MGRSNNALVGDAAGAHLGKEEVILAVHARVVRAVPDLALVGVRVGGVDMQVAQSEGALHGLDALLAGELSGARAQRGDLLSLDRLVLHASSNSYRAHAYHNTPDLLSARPRTSLACGRRSREAARMESDEIPVR